MFPVNLCLLLAMAGQCANGYCPAPQPTQQYARQASYNTIPSARHWYQTPTVGWVRGWVDASGYILYFDAENLDSATTREAFALQAIQAMQSPKTVNTTKTPPPIPPNPDLAKPLTRPTPKPDPDDDSPLFPRSRPEMKTVAFKIGDGVPNTNYGVDLGKTFTTPKDEDHFETSGPKSEAFADKVKTIIAGRNNDAEVPMLKDDSHKPFVVIIGTEEEQETVLARLKDLKDIAHICAYSKDNWAVKDSGHVREDASGQKLSEVVVQQASGAVQARLPITTAAQPVIDAVHKADPTYNPNDDPGVSGGGTSPSMKEKVTAGVIIVCAVFALIGGILLKMFTPGP